MLGVEVPLLAHVASQIGDPQVRHRGTIGGSLAHADPAGDLPAIVLALDGTLVVDGQNGRRTIPAAGFFRSLMESALAPDEVLTEVRVPRVAGRGWAFEKFSRRAQDWAIVGAAAQRVESGAAVALVHMGLTPLRAAQTEAALASGVSPDQAAALADRDTDPPSDLNGSAEYRRHLARVLVGRALIRALA